MFLTKRKIATASSLAQRFHQFVRNTNFKRLEEKDVAQFEKILPEIDTQVLTPPRYGSLEGFNNDWLGKIKGKSQIVLRPKTTEQVSQILNYCNANKLAVVPQGGNTGLAGGSVPLFDEIIINLSLMNQVLDFDSVSGSITCQSGCILENLNQYLAPYGYMMPLDLAPKGTCQIGGNLATAAGGLRYLRYKSLHANVLGLEVVLANGTILNTLRHIRKDNTGYHMDHLFIGSEGTLGIITAASLHVPPKPNSVNVILLAVEDFKQVQHIYKSAKLGLGEILSAFEFFDRECLDLVLKHSSRAVYPFDTKFPFYVLIETHGSNAQHDEQKLYNFFETVTEKSYAVDGTLAFDEVKAKNLWSLREDISESLRKEGYVYKYDISVPLPKMYDLISDMRTRLKPFQNNGVDDAKVYGFGHLGDDNLHINMTTTKYNETVMNLIEPFVYEWTKERNGSVSSEHGIGSFKLDYLSFSKSAPSIQMMKQMKQLFDPNQILNPYKVILP